ncbi:hypothetical protein [Agaribacter flavus]|uniref:Uncharacterized protein n=1 Tax=Agaribacter flavus TaxID=1902781 RepID=A0ABV7FM11_9ALTE
MKNISVLLLAAALFGTNAQAEIKSNIDKDLLTVKIKNEIQQELENIQSVELNQSEKSFSVKLVKTKKSKLNTASRVRTTANAEDE